MSPQDIPYLICGTFCLIPLLFGLSGFFLPFIFSKRLPVLRVSRWIEKARKIISFELSLETREMVKAMKKKEPKE